MILSSPCAALVTAVVTSGGEELGKLDDRAFLISTLLEPVMRRGVLRSDAIFPLLEVIRGKPWLGSALMVGNRTVELGVAVGRKALLVSELRLFFFLSR